MVAGGRARRDPRRAGGICAGLACHPLEDDRPASRPHGAPTRRARARRRGRRHRHARLQPRRVHHRRRSRDAVRRSAHLRGRPQARRQCPYAAALCGGRERHALVQPGGGGPSRTISRSASMARRAASSGIRRTRTTSPSRPSESRPARSAATAMAPTRPPAPPRASPADTLKATSKASPSFIRTWRSRSRRASRSANPAPSRFRFRRWIRASAACASSRPQCALAAQGSLGGSLKHRKEGIIYDCPLKAPDGTVGASTLKSLPQS